MERVEIAIIDGSGEPADHARAIFSVADLDDLIGIEGAGQAIGVLRRLYAARIRDTLLPLCRRIAASETTEVLASDDSRAADHLEAEGDADADQPNAIPLSRHRHVTVGIASVGGRA